MPVTLVDRLPLPNLKAYTTGSILLLSVAVYYAMSVTSDPNWRANATLQRQEAMIAEADGDSLKVVQSVGEAVLEAGGSATRNFTEQFIEVVTFMMQEPLCMWTVINTAYCCLAVFGFLIQRFVFGQLRVAEAQRVKDKFWNYVFYKFIFVFGVINVQYMDEVLLWCAWFTILGFLQLLSQLCKDRFDYLSSSPNTERWAHARLLCLVGGVQAAGAALLVVAAVWGLPAGCDTFVFMAAECVLVLVSSLHVVARYALQVYEADVAGPLSYYTHLVFESVSLVVELVDVVHMVVYSNMLVSMASLVLLMQLRHLLHELQARLRRHRTYTTLAHHMSRNYPMASKEEVEKNQDNCAICWEPMKEARKLPCSHLFHNSCLCQWVQQDASCPTCRRALAAGPRAPPAPARAARPAHPAPPAHAAPPPPPNHLFHFDGQFPLRVVAAQLLGGGDARATGARAPGRTPRRHGATGAAAVPAVPAGGAGARPGRHALARAHRRQHPRGPPARAQPAQRAQRAQRRPHARRPTYGQRPVRCSVCRRLAHRRARPSIARTTRRRGVLVVVVGSPVLAQRGRAAGAAAAQEGAARGRRAPPLPAPPRRRRAPRRAPRAAPRRAPRRAPPAQLSVPGHADQGQRRRRRRVPPRAHAHARARDARSFSSLNTLHKCDATILSTPPTSTRSALRISPKRTRQSYVMCACGRHTRADIERDDSYGLD